MKTLRNSISIGLALTMVGACAAWAQEAESDTWMTQPLATPRAVVVAERDAALRMARSGAQVIGDLAWMEAGVSTRTRAQVRAELAASIASGEFERLQAEAPSFEPLPARAVWVARRSH
jgi:hypothetical protein